MIWLSWRIGDRLSVSTLEEVEAEHIIAEPTLHMLKATTLSATWKVIIDPFRPILHILHKPLLNLTEPRNYREALS
jgi:hypothetical protein